MSLEEKPRVLRGKEKLEYISRLVKLKVDLVNWTVLWQDPVTGELWKEYYPHSERHGGGPSEFVTITEEQAVEEFGPIQ